MKNLVMTVSPESSIDLLKSFADVIILDKESAPIELPFYDTLYIRSHFGDPSTMPEVFRSSIDNVVHRARYINPNIKFIDGTDTVDKVMSTEDKWNQYQVYGSLMPKTKPLSDDLDVAGFIRPIFKKPLLFTG